jgi:hypothetical protein
LCEYLFRAGIAAELERAVGRPVPGDPNTETILFYGAHAVRCRSIDTFRGTGSGLSLILKFSIGRVAPQ